MQPALLVGLVIVTGWLLSWTLEAPRLPPDVRAAGAPIILAGLGLLAWAIIVQVQAGNNPEIHQPTHRLVVGGPYRFTRNPIYLGFLIAQLGIGFTIAWPIAVLVPFSGYLLHQFVILPEEAQLAIQFPEYVDYCQRVRRWV